MSVFVHETGSLEVLRETQLALVKIDFCLALFYRRIYVGNNATAADVDVEFVELFLRL